MIKRILDHFRRKKQPKRIDDLKDFIEMAEFYAAAKDRAEQRAEQAEARVKELEKVNGEIMGCWQPLADACNRYRSAVEPIVNLDKAFKGGHVEDFHIEQQAIDDIVASYDDLIAPMVFPYAPTYQDLVKKLATAREALERARDVIFQYQFYDALKWTTNAERIF